MSDIFRKRINIIFFKVTWRRIIAVTMNSYCVVKGIDIFKHQLMRMSEILDFEAVEPLSFDKRMKRFNAGIVIRITLLGITENVTFRSLPICL